MAEKLKALGALQDVADNNGTMWRCNGHEAHELWGDLKRRRWVEWNPWARCYQPTVAGLAALRDMESAK